MTYICYTWLKVQNENPLHSRDAMSKIEQELTTRNECTPPIKHHSTIIFASSIDMTSTFPLTSSPVGVSTPIVEKVTAPPLASPSQFRRLISRRPTTVRMTVKESEAMSFCLLHHPRTRSLETMSFCLLRRQRERSRRVVDASWKQSQVRLNRLTNVRVKSYVHSRWRNR
jgi:hypothetical protein